MSQRLYKAVKKLTEEDKNQLSNFQKEALKSLLEDYKPVVPFSKATLDDCVRPDGLALNIDYALIDAPTLHIPDDFAVPTASAHLCEKLRRIKSVWVLDNKKSCRMMIDAILIEALSNESNEKLFGFCAVKNDWEGTGFGYTGDVDYMFGSSRIKFVDTMDSCLLVSQANKDWPQSAVPQIIAEAGCLLKRRLAAGKNTPVFAVLTNGEFFRFFAIDTNGIVYSSGIPPLILQYGPNGDYNPSLSEILRWFAWFMTCIKSISPEASSEDLTPEKIQDSLTQLRDCFGPKYPISSKKIKFQK